MKKIYHHYCNKAVGKYIIPNLASARLDSQKIPGTKLLPLEKINGWNGSSMLSGGAPTCTSWHITVCYMKNLHTHEVWNKHNGAMGMGHLWLCVGIVMGGIQLIKVTVFGVCSINAGEYPFWSLHDHRIRSLWTPDPWPTTERAEQLLASSLSPRLMQNRKGAWYRFACNIAAQRHSNNCKCHDAIL